MPAKHTPWLGLPLFYAHIRTDIQATHGLRAGERTLVLLVSDLRRQRQVSAHRHTDTHTHIHTVLCTLVLLVSVSTDPDSVATSTDRVPTSDDICSMARVTCLA